MKFSEQEKFFLVFPAAIALGLRNTRATEVTRSVLEQTQQRKSTTRYNLKEALV